MTKHPDCEDGCQLKEHKGYRDCIETGVCHFMTDSKKEELLKACDRLQNEARIHRNLATNHDSESVNKLVQDIELVATALKSLLTKRDSAISILTELVELKDIKENIGATSDYQHRKPLAWKKAKEFLIAQPCPKQERLIPFTITLDSEQGIEAERYVPKREKPE